MIFHNYPYTDAHELNLDWLIAQIKKINSTLNNFIVMNTVKYADPFQWSITTQYESNTIVMEPNTGVAYISVQPVPAGVSISNTSFWTPVFDLSQLFGNFNDNITFNNEYQNIVSAHVYSAGSWLIWKNELYLVTAAINLGSALQPGVNIERKTIEELQNALENYLIGIINAITRVYPFDTVSDMKDADLTAGIICRTSGYFSINDGGDALYIIKASAPSVHYETLNNGLYAELIASSPINIRQLGAVGDGATDDSAVLSEAVSLYDEIFIPAGNFKIDSRISWNGSKRIIGCGKASVLYGDDILGITGHGGALNSIENVMFESDDGSTGEAIILGETDPCVNVFIKGCYFYHCGTAIVAKGETDTVTISNCYFFRIGSCDIYTDGSAISYASWTIENNHIQAYADNHTCIYLKKVLNPIISNNVMQSDAREHVQHIYLSQCASPRLINNYHEILGASSIDNKACIISECNDVTIDGANIGGDCASTSSNSVNSLIDISICERVNVHNIEYNDQSSHADYVLNLRRCRYVNAENLVATDAAIAPADQYMMFDEFISTEGIRVQTAPVAYGKKEITLALNATMTLNLADLIPGYASYNAYMLNLVDRSGPYYESYFIFMNKVEELAGNAAGYTVTASGDVITIQNGEAATTHLKVSIVALTAEQITV